MTGAKISVIDNIIQITIQQGKLLANGSIDSTSVGWKSLLGKK